MPLEIRELIIKVTIEEHAPKAVGNSIGSRELQVLKEKIVRECMDKLISNMDNLSVR
ncbi:DUF5908 family protein [Chitinophaga sp. GbtcB8]|jgi:hypothetical protein|uniref:DUF5908 family protein n=1 Tax=Chitinophaga sp. GbtcB8 TaxID=2824753 RepID=UPI001C30A938|nr:DUF5908 family protein [Chitinophaga sp. GbtcB8]